MAHHRLTVDAYAVQHPGKNEPRAVQSVNVHLLSLYLILVKGLPYDFATKAMAKMIEKKKNQFRWLPPPQSVGEIKVTDVVKAADASEHTEIVKTWAKLAWDAWFDHHTVIQDLAREVL